MILIVVGLVATAAGIAAGWTARSYTLHRRITILRDIARQFDTDRAEVRRVEAQLFGE